MKRTKVGRPSNKELSKTGPKTNWKMTDELLGKLKYAFAIGCTVSQACSFADIDISTYYAWEKRYPEFSKSCRRLQDRPILRAKDTVFKGLKDDPKLAFDYLKAKLKDEFKEVINIESKSVHLHIVDIINGLENKPNGLQEDRRQDVQDAESVQDQE